MMIDIDDGLMKVCVQYEEVSFNLFEAMKHSKDKGECFRVNATDEAILNVRKQAHISTPLEIAFTDAFNVINLKEEKEIEECLKELDTVREVPLKEAKLENLKEEVVQENNKLGLKMLPDHLKYVFLEE